MYNKVPRPAEVRRPRAIVTVNGTPFKWLEWSTNTNGFFQADTFDVTFPESGQPAGIDVAWWESTTSMEVAIYAGFPANPDFYSVADLKVVIIGKADDLEYDPVKKSYTLNGRDYAAVFIDTKQSVQFQNHTSSAIATELALKHGLKPVVTRTAEQSGTIFKQVKANMDSMKTEWDVLASLAQDEGFDLFVIGKELHFQAPLSPPPSYLLQWRQDDAYPTLSASDLKLKRNLTLSNDVVVTIRSREPGKKDAYTVQAKSKHSGKKSGEGSPRNYLYFIPGLSKSDAQKRADKKAQEIAKHERKMSLSLPGDVDLTPRHVIQLRGVPGWEQDYYPDSITRQMSLSSGFTMEVTAKNQDQRSEVKG